MNNFVSYDNDENEENVKAVVRDKPNKSINLKTRIKQFINLQSKVNNFTCFNSKCLYQNTNY